MSDGSLGLEELLAMAKRRGLSALSITDHDTVAGATRAVIIGKRLGLPVIHGVEFSTFDTKRMKKAHVLCYLCEVPDRLEGLCHRIGEARRTAAIESIKKIMRYYPIVPEMITKCASGSTGIFKQHMMHALMDAGYADSIFGETYQKLFGENGVARISLEYPDPREVITAIHEAGGIAVLAHPAQYGNEELLEELAGEGLDGVEVWHPAHSEAQVSALQEFAEHKKLLKTGGSDYHGMYGDPIRPLASAGTPDEALQALISYKDKRKRKK